MDGSGKGMTFDDLTSVYRTEMGAASLGKVRRDLYPAMRALYAELVNVYRTAVTKGADSHILDGSYYRADTALSYIKKVTEERMRKILSSCVSATMGGEGPVDLMTPEERKFYDSVIAAGKRIIDAGYEKPGTVPDITETPPKRSGVETAAPKVTPKAHVAPEAYVPDSLGDIPVFDDDSPETNVPDTGDAAPLEEEEENIFGKRVTVVILEDLEKFAGPERDYDLSKGDVVRMPAVMAKSLVNHGKARLAEIRP